MSSPEPAQGLTVDIQSYENTSQKPPLSPVSVSESHDEREALVQKDSPSEKQEELNKKEISIPIITFNSASPVQEIHSKPITRRVTKAGSASHLFLYTKSVPTPRLVHTAAKSPFLLRIGQLTAAVTVFAVMCISAFTMQMPYYALGPSGLNFMFLVSISSMFVTVSSVFVYSFPAILNVPPQRYMHSSSIEVAVDLLYAIFWLSSSTVMVSATSKNLDESGLHPVDLKSSWSWTVSYAVGYVAMLFFLTTATIGIIDIHKARKSPVAAGRGNWRDWGSDDNLEHSK